MLLLDELAAAVVAEGCGTAACVAVSDGRGVTSGASGHVAPGGPSVDAETPFDLASVTKVVTTGVLASLVGRGEVRLDDPCGRYLPEAAFGTRTVRELLGHRAGLVAWEPWFDAARRDPRCSGLWPDGSGDACLATAADVLRATALATPAGAPGERRYSDLGFLALGWLVEGVAGAPLDRVVLELVTAPLGLGGLGFRRRSVASADSRVPVTGAWRPREPAPGQEERYRVGPQLPALRPGEVDDDHAWTLDGVAGHAGLFGAAPALAAFGRAVVEELSGAERIAPADVWAELVAPDPANGPVRALGFDRPAAEGSSIGGLLGRGPRGAVGHLGFTGTSLWIDLDHGVSVALLTNRTYPCRASVVPIRRARPRTHDAIARAWGIG